MEADQPAQTIQVMNQEYVAYVEQVTSLLDRVNTLLKTHGSISGDNALRIIESIEELKE